LIIADDITEGNRHNNNLCDWIRFSDLSFSDLGNFRLSSIPIILCKREIRAEYQTNNHYNNVLPFIDDDKDLRIVDYSKKAVKSWREEILNDLETLKLDLNQLKIFGSQFMHLSPAYNKIARNYSHYFGVTKIVSENFIKTPNSLNYDWLSHDHLIKVERSYEGYNRIIKKLFKYNGKKIERQVLHAFYKKNKHFLLRDTYEKFLYEKRFYLSSTSHFHIPDFILTSPFPGLIRTSISEIKRHNIEFEYLPKQHKNFTNYFQNSLNQASNYQDDFENEKNQKYLEEEVGDNKFQMDLIIGLDDKLTELILRKVQKHYSSINVTTHTQLLKNNEDYYNRLKELNIASSIFLS